MFDDDPMRVVYLLLVLVFALSSLARVLGNSDGVVPISATGVLRIQ